MNVNQNARNYAEKGNNYSKLRYNFEADESAKEVPTISNNYSKLRYNYCILAFFY
mgnify:CR=1 FL=1